MASDELPSDELQNALLKQKLLGDTVPLEVFDALFPQKYRCDEEITVTD